MRDNHMSASRTVTQRDGRFQVSNDPDNALGYLLNSFVGTPFAGEATQRFAPTGPGLALLDTILAVRADASDWTDLPMEQVPADLDREWWLVSIERPSGRASPAAVIIDGDELRDLFRSAGLWST